MKGARQMFFHYSLLLGIIVHILCQVFKLIYYSLKEGRFNLHYLLTAGGMPSTHSAFTGTVTLCLGLLKGFDSEYFALGFAFTAVVVYDSLRLRGAVQSHSEILIKLTAHLEPALQKDIPRMVGHTLPEIIVGLFLALVVSLAGYALKGYFGL